MPTLIEFFYLDGIHLAEVTTRDAKGLRATDASGRQHRVANDRVLFEHQGQLEGAKARIETLSEEIDLPLLWETLLDEEDLATKSAKALAESYFGEVSSYHASAIFHVALEDRLHFRRRGKELAPRNAEELDELRKQREAEAAAAAERQALKDALERGEVDAELATRLQHHLRGQPDRALKEALELALGGEASPKAHWLLVDTGYLPKSSTPELLAANLPTTHPEDVKAHAAGLALPPKESLEEASFSIDDPDTREVDDALSVKQEGALWCVTIDIADTAAFVQPNDPVDGEARLRSTTIYLPTGMTPMLPEYLSCELGSLHAGQERPALRTSVWLNDEGEVERFTMEAKRIRVARRLDYEEADQLLKEPTDEVGEQLAALYRLALKRQEIRRGRGALLLARKEWKIKVEDEGASISAEPLDAKSPSRLLVAEMMILTNELAATMAQEAGLPLIYRTQDAPLEALGEIKGDDPATFFALRKHIKPATLSLHARPHWGLGLEAYTQVTSPLRRYGDMIQQRQLHAHLLGQAPPHAASELLEVLAGIEATEQQAKRLEAAVKQYWMLEYAARLSKDEPLAAQVVGKVKGGYRVRLDSCGAEGLLMESAELSVGGEVRVLLEKVRPRTGSLRARQV
ncbi:MAG: RNB domain-containing ribonuclease [Deltaproteobacteria bacterium]|nr:RNB domain-containing ribonuclease [Deltaproteobacteria bacterium]